MLWLCVCVRILYVCVQVCVCACVSMCVYVSVCVHGNELRRTSFTSVREYPATAALISQSCVTRLRKKC